MRYLERLLRLFGDSRDIVRILFESFFCEESGLYFYPGLCDIRAQACALKRKQPVSLRNEALCDKCRKSFTFSLERDEIFSKSIFFPPI